MPSDCGEAVLQHGIVKAEKAVLSMNLNYDEVWRAKQSLSQSRIFMTFLNPFPLMSFRSLLSSMHGVCVLRYFRARTVLHAEP